MSSATAPSNGFEARMVVEPGRIVVRVRGEVDMATTKVLEQTADGALAAEVAGPIVVDLSEVTFIDAAGLTGLLRLRQRALAGGRALEIVEASGVVRRLAAITGLDGDILGPASPEPA